VTSARDKVVSDARRLLEIAGDEPLETSAETVAGLIAAVESRLAGLPGPSARQGKSPNHGAQLERLSRRYETRFAAMDSVREAVDRLREITSPLTILTRAPEELCRASQLDRVLVSVVRDGHIVAQAAHFRDDAAGAAAALEALGDISPRLEHPLIEADLLRRRRATIVTDAQLHPRVHRPTAQVMAWSSYVAAPLLVRGEVIGVIHADRPSGRDLDVLDGDVLWAFATGLAEAYETASLRRSLRRQSTEMRAFMDWFGARSNELSDASMALAPEQEEPPDPPGKLGVTAAASHADDRIVFEDLLTRRELDVLRQLVRGQTNGAIAAQLVISQATVKFHVTNVLRKLHVRNRAEAVSRYHRLLRGSPATPRAPRTPSGLPGAGW
jgi:LuxR family transcriptional regulator, regulator of acetate metabolism